MPGRLLVFPLVAVLGVSGACTSSSGVSGGGGPARPAGLSCLMDLEFTGPVGGQLDASLNVTCDFTVTSSTTVLSIRSKPAGSGEMAWHNYDSPKSSARVPPLSLDFKAYCSPGQWEAEATIDGAGPNAQPFHSSATEQLPDALTRDDCTS